MNRHERRAAAAAARQGRAVVDARASTEARQGGAAVADPLAAAAAELHRRVAQEAEEVSKHLLGGDSSPTTLGEVVAGALDVAERFARSRPASPTVLACKKGCSHCCSRPVSTSAPMVLRIATLLRQDLDRADFEAVLSRVAALDEKTHGLPFSLSVRPPTPCALLVDDACSIHAIRPFVCRAWNSTSEETCKRALKVQGLPMQIDLFQRTVYSAAEKGMHAALRRKGLDPVDLELTAALRVAMENTDAAERWLAGEPIFAGCEAKHDPDDRYHLPTA